MSAYLAYPLAVGIVIGVFAAYVSVVLGIRWLAMKYPDRVMVTVIVVFVLVASYVIAQLLM